MTLRAGDRLGVYEIVAPLGAGGMGEVYRARDTTLQRDVAIKVLSAAFTDDADRLARFEREARVLAALNHPHVGAIYGIEKFGGAGALVLELVDGDTLADRIRRGPLPVGEALRIARQISSAIDAAHKKGIVHRDLKPANIKLTADGAVKVLDFGLAKMADKPAPELSQVLTITAHVTQPGLVMGTASYMSPEQARGGAVDTRTDIWALGCVLYEMLAGRRAFDGPTFSDVIAKVLEREPDWTALPRDAPAAVRQLLRRCLARDPDERVQDMSAVRTLLDWGVTADAPRTSYRVAVGVIVAVAALSVGAYRWLAADLVDPSDPARWQQLTAFPDSATQPALSPDGRMLTFVRGEGTLGTIGEIYLKHLPDGDATPLTHDQMMKMDPVFSPDANRIAYTVTFDAASMRSTWDTWEVPVVRGEPRRWLVNAASLTWIRPGALMFSRLKNGNHMGVVTASETAADVKELYFPEHEARMVHRSWLSPDGRWVLVAEMDERGVFAPCQVISVSGATSRRPVGPAAGACTTAAWAPDGRQMYFTIDAGDGMHIWRQRFPAGTPEQLTRGTATQEEGLAMAPDGRSVISSVGQQRRGIWLRNGSAERQISPEGYAFWPQLSADGSRLVFRVSRGSAGGRTPSELWMTDLTSGRVERLLPGKTIIQYDLSRDDRVVAAVSEGDSTRLWVAWLDSREPPRPLRIEASTPRVGPTGEIIFTATEGNALHLFRTDFAGATPDRVVSEQVGGVLGAVSPDGLWISDNLLGETKALSMVGQPSVTILKNAVARLRWTPDGKHVLLAVQAGAGPSAFGFGRTYVLPLEIGETLPRTPPGGFSSEAAVAAVPGVQIFQNGDLAFGPHPGVQVFSKIMVTRNLYRIPLP